MSLKTRFIPSISNTEKTSLLSELLPYAPEVKAGARLKDGLKEHLLLLTTLENVLEKLNLKDLSSFDPLVGENACQIRAIKLALILWKYPIDANGMLPEVRLKRLKCKSLLSDVVNLMQKGFSLKDFLVKGKLDVKLTYNELFLLQSYLLTKVKVNKPPKEENPLIKNESTDTKKIKEISSVGSMFADRLVKKLRHEVSKSSILFVQELAEQLESGDHLREMVSQKFVRDHKNLKCLPCFWMTRVLMESTLNYEIPIVVLAQLKSKDRDYEIEHELALCFKATPLGYQEVSPSELKSYSTAIVLQGNTCREFRNLPSLSEWKDEMVKCGPINLMLAYSATHRQYPNNEPVEEDLSQQIESDEFLYYKKRADAWGCCIKNPSRFFLSHAYCDSFENVLHKRSLKGFVPNN